MVAILLSAMAIRKTVLINLERELMEQLHPNYVHRIQQISYSIMCYWFISDYVDNTFDQEYGDMA